MGGDRRNEKGKKREQSAAISAAKKGERRIDIRAGERLDNLLKDGWGKWNSERGRKIHWEGVFVLFLMLSTEYLLYIFRYDKYQILTISRAEFMLLFLLKVKLLTCYVN